MNTTKEKRYYSPHFSEMAAVAVRRFAWALNGNMGQAVDVLVSCLPGFIDTKKVCSVCRDKTKCKVCVFEFVSDLPEQAAALLYS
jgi:recombinational DNA repair protein RecR